MGIRAAFAFLGIDGPWRSTRQQNSVHERGVAFDFLTEWLVENHDVPALCLAVIDGPGRSGHSEHLFQTNGLCAELNVIGHAAVFVAGPLVLHWIRLPEPFTARHGDTRLRTFARQKLDNIGLAGDAKPKRSQRKSSPNQNFGPGFNLG